MKKIFKSVILISCLAIMILFGGNVFAKEALKMDAGILTDPIPETALNYAEEIAFKLSSTFLAMPDSSGLKENQEIYLGNGFYTYTLRDGNLEKNNTINFPVLQNGSIVLLLHVIQTEDNSWTGTASYSYSDELNLQKQKESVESSIIVYQNDKAYLVNSTESLVLEENVPVEQIGDSEKPIGFTSLNLSEFNMQNSLIFQNATDSLGKVLSPVSKNQPRMAGFSVYTDNYKLLEMSNCFLLQNDEYGVRQGLCWAATAGTIIRYKTGNRSVEGWKIAKELGIDYFNDIGGNPWDIYEALRRYGAQIDYSVCSRGAYSMVEVQHNINNRFPVAISAGNYENPYHRGTGHAVTLIGYNGNTLIYWNSATGRMETTILNYPNTYITMEGTSYRWDRSVMAPYGTPWSIPSSN